MKDNTYTVIVIHVASTYYLNAIHEQYKHVYPTTINNADKVTVHFPLSSCISLL